jgi:hypothetical protein
MSLIGSSFNEVARKIKKERKKIDEKEFLF